MGSRDHWTRGLSPNALQYGMGYGVKDVDVAPPVDSSKHGATCGRTERKRERNEMKMLQSKKEKMTHA